MNLLLDTHAFLWFVWDDERLSQTAKRLIEDPSHAKHVSVASGWEIAIKCSLGKLRLDDSAATFIPRELAANGFALMSITLKHVAGVENLPFHHRDPFDRLIVAQCLSDALDVVSRDSSFDEYGIRRHW
jgi:PIN domain nuclease of toxin-antitoxin system